LTVNWFNSYLCSNEEIEVSVYKNPTWSLAQA
jgi:hypothetical protein